MVQFKQPLTSTSSATDTVAVVCTVQEVDLPNLMTSVIDQVGTKRKVSLKALPGKPTSYPIAGERWVISREYGDWMFVASVNVAPVGGAQGPQGVQGAQGPQGTQGSQGAQPAIPSGVIWQFGGSSPPTGWLLCDGSSQLQASFPALFAVIGTTYGSVDGTHFNLPDFTNKFPRGNFLGTGGGNDNHTHSSAAHSHSLSSAGWSLLQFTTTIIEATKVTIGSWTGNSAANYTGSSTSSAATTSAISLGGATDSASPGPTGSSSNIPVYTGVSFIIKT